MIRFDNVSKIFKTGVAALSDITLLIDKGEFVFLVGPTGSGKTTLLKMLVRDVLPTHGTIIVSDLDVVKLPASKIPHLRKKVGFIFQDLKLLTERTILENIVLPMQIVGISLDEGTKKAEELLQMVGLLEHRDKFPIQLSGGELQRVAIARSLALSPEILLADEPTGNLDPDTALEIVELLEKINDMGTTILMATHNLDIVKKLKKRVVGLDKGKIVKDEKGDKKETREDGTNVKKHDRKEDSKDTNKSEESKENKDDEKEKTEEHKKETKKLSDLLAKARSTLHRNKTEDLPFGFEKEADIKEK